MDILADILAGIGIGIVAFVLGLIGLFIALFILGLVACLLLLPLGMGFNVGRSLISKAIDFIDL